LVKAIIVVSIASFRDDGPMMKSGKRGDMCADRLPQPAPDGMRPVHGAIALTAKASTVKRAR
jgi:hypothetical protein